MIINVKSLSLLVESVSRPLKTGSSLESCIGRNLPVSWCTALSSPAARPSLTAPTEPDVTAGLPGARD